MEAPLDTNFLIRRITQLWVEAADLPDRSPAQAHIEELACKLSDYVSKLADEASKEAQGPPSLMFFARRLNTEPRDATPNPIQVAQHGAGMPVIDWVRLLRYRMRGGKGRTCDW